MTGPLWQPTAERAAAARLTAFIREARAAGSDATDMASLHRWSVAEPRAFWPAVWRFCGVVSDQRDGADPWDDVVVGLDRMAPPDPRLGPAWFPGARLNYAENLLRRSDNAPAIIAWTEEGPARVITFAGLRREVTRMASALRAAGVRKGDRVAGFLPNIPETVIAMLGAAAIGAVWSSCSPDFGPKAVQDRLGQIEPRVLVAADGYRYAGKAIDVRDRVRDIRDDIASIERVVLVPVLGQAALDGTVLWDDFLAPHDGNAEPVYARLPFDHPLFIMYSSGTTGLPKCMVHGAGGTLLQHLKEHALHTDLRRDDRLFYFTTCGWMMWNWLVSGLASGAAIVLYEGAPMPPAHPKVLWELAAAERLTALGTSARWLALCERNGMQPGSDHDLGALRTVLSTGSPLSAASFEWVYRAVKADLHLASISGGTDIISCFALGDPTGPVWPGEIQTRGLGMKVEVLGAGGRPVQGTPGELCCTMPFPSMPVRFWNDPDGKKYEAAYFAVWDNVWRHGDWAELTDHLGIVIHGRSDATLNPGGVRIGTAEIYRQVERVPEVVEGIVIGQEFDDDVRIVLFVRLAEGVALDDALRARIRDVIRAGASPHHVPRKIIAVPDLPRTVSGKLSELAVRQVVHGRAVENADALANPRALDHFRDLEELRT